MSGSHDPTCFCRTLHMRNEGEVGNDVEWFAGGKWERMRNGVKKAIEQCHRDLDNITKEENMELTALSVATGFCASSWKTRYQLSDPKVLSLYSINPTKFMSIRTGRHPV